MFIENLRVDQFSHLRDTFADGLHPRLNVFGCAHESTCDTVRDFLRWMLFGTETTAFRETPYTGSAPHRSFAGSMRGSMSVTVDGRRRQIQRASDSDYGRLSIDGRYDDSAREVRTLVGRITRHEFDTIFAPLLCRDIHPDELVAAVGSTRLDLTSRPIPNGQKSQWQARHRQLRAELDRLPRNEALVQLTERRTYLLRRIDELNHQQQLQREELDRQYNEISRRVAEVSRDVDRLRSEYQLRDKDANRRRTSLQEAWRLAQQAKEAYVFQRQEELNEVEGRTRRWHEILNEVRTRLADVLELRRSLPSIELSDRSTCLVAGLAENLDRLQPNVDDWAQFPTSPHTPSTATPRTDSHSRSDERYIRPSLDELRREVSRLCHTLQIHKSNSNQDRWLENEADHLQQCESLMSQWLTKLESQLDVIRREVAGIKQRGLELVNNTNGLQTPSVRYTQTVWPYDVGNAEHVGYYRANTYENPNDLSSADTRHYYSHSHSEIPPFSSYAHDPYFVGYPDGDGTYRREYPTWESASSSDDLARGEATIGTRSLVQSGMQAVPHACHGYDVSHPDADVSLHELVDRRNQALGELDNCQRELESLESQRNSLDERRRQSQDHEIQVVRRELSELESRFHAAEERARLEREMAYVVDQMRHAHDEVRQSPVVEQASRTLGRLTGGRFNQVRIEGGRHVAVDDAQGIAVSLVDCSRELRSDTSLSLCLALVSECRRQGVELPLVLNEPFVMTNHGHDRHRAAVLRDFADSGHQVIVITSRSITRELFRGFDYVFADLEPRPSFRPIASPLPRITEPPIVDEPPETPSTQQEFEDQVRFKRRTGAAPVEFRSGQEPRDVPGVAERIETAEKARLVTPSDMHDVTPIQDPSLPIERPITSRDISPVSFSDEQHSLSLTSPIESTQVIDPEIAKWLRANDIVTVREFLELMSADLILELTNEGFAPCPVRHWQDELALRCWVVGLAAEDAAMLVACGIVDTEQLAEMDSDELYSVLVRGLRTQNDSTYDTQRLDNLPKQVHFWIRAARRSRTDWGRFRTRSFGKRAWSRSRDARMSRPPSIQSSNKSNPSTADGPQTVDSSSSAQPISLSGSRSTREPRTSRGSQSPPAPSTPSPADAVAATRIQSTTSSDAELRFYLNTSDSLVDAPSIGPRTAGYFRKIGVNTVAEFINLEPESAASQISVRRITAKTIRTWQAQAALACRVPQLRGHDAQILVACGIHDPTTLARMDPSELWGRVKPFVKTAEGKRIIRGGKTPDLQEVEEWIRWAKQSRILRAA